MNENTDSSFSLPLWPFVVVPYALVFFSHSKDGWWLFLVPPLVGLVFAVNGLLRRRSVWPGVLTFLGTSLVLVAVMIPNTLHADVRGTINQVWEEQRQLRWALDQYAEKHGQFPPAIDALQLPCADPFNEGRNYAYWTDGAHWLLRSAGPDHYDDLPASWIESASDEPAERWKKWLEPYQYEPTNSIKSPGDIISTGP